MNIYIAASFCYEDKKKTSERKYLIEKTVKRVQRFLPGDYHSYYLPHQLTIPNAWDISLEEWAKAVYEADRCMLDKADLVIFISFGKENNAGSAWEIGYAVGQKAFVTDEGFPWEETFRNRKIICIKMTEEPESLMITNSVDAIISEAEIEDYNWSRLPKYRTKMEKIS